MCCGAMGRVPFYAAAENKLSMLNFPDEKNGCNSGSTISGHPGEFFTCDASIPVALHAGTETLGRDVNCSTPDNNFVAIKWEEETADHELDDELEEDIASYKAHNHLNSSTKCSPLDLFFRDLISEITEENNPENNDIQIVFDNHKSHRAATSKIGYEDEITRNSKSPTTYSSCRWDSNPVSKATKDACLRLPRRRPE